MGLGGAYAFGALSAFCPPLALGVGAGLLVYGVYGLINGGAAALVADGPESIMGKALRRTLTRRAESWAALSGAYRRRRGVSSLAVRRTGCGQAGH